LSVTTFEPDDASAFWKTSKFRLTVSMPCMPTDNIYQARSERLLKFFPTISATGFSVKSRTHLKRPIMAVKVRQGLELTQRESVYALPRMQIACDIIR
jgi:hypothetical protein